MQAGVGLASSNYQAYAHSNVAGLTNVLEVAKVGFEDLVIFVYVSEQPMRQTPHTGGAAHQSVWHMSEKCSAFVHALSFIMNVYQLQQQPDCCGR